MWQDAPVKTTRRRHGAVARAQHQPALKVHVYLQALNHDHCRSVAPGTEVINTAIVAAVCVIIKNAKNDTE
jgi:hypothetical protein